MKLRIKHVFAICNETRNTLVLSITNYAVYIADDSSKYCVCVSLFPIFVRVNVLSAQMLIQTIK